MKAASPPLHLHAVTASILTLQLTGVFVAVSRNWYQYFPEKQDCKSMGMQLYETGWACVTAYGCWEELSHFLFNSFFTYFSFSSADSFPHLSLTLRSVCPLGSMSFSFYICPGLYSGTETSWKETAPSPSITFLKLPAVGDHNQAAYGERFLVHDGFAAVPRNCWKRGS